ncbi:MAG: TetR/AcrR family transcriptional regulator [Minwuia sp.]|nr:TetR/AcrR family transcriptional regulator [Minwuia sp.]
MDRDRQDTREQLLQAAGRLFAESGFYGVSIARIADELGLTKQALLHHFASKEKLYAEVLQRISAGFTEQATRAPGTDDQPGRHFEHLILDLADRAQRDQMETQLLMRELLDNRRRADTAGTWYLKPFLEALANRLRQVPGWADVAPASALAAVYQLLGAINYFAISGPTLRNMFGEAHHDALLTVQHDRLLPLIRATIANPPTG